MSGTVEWARQWVYLTAQAMSEKREYLIELDRQIGDGDHGENMDRGFSAVVKGGGLEEAISASDVLKYVAKTLLSTVGGAAGPLYGTAYLRAASQISEDDFTAADVANLLRAGVEGIQLRGKAEAGEKTMVDAWLEALSAAEMAQEAKLDLAQTWMQVAAAARAGAEATIGMKATKGRASYLGQRSVGHLDPGAESSALIMDAAMKSAQTFSAQGAR